MTENKSLMRMTKQELVNIILRKDDVNNKLRDDIRELKDKVANRDGCMTDKDKYIIRLKEEVVKLNAVVKNKVEYIDKANLSIEEQEKELTELNGQLDELRDAYDKYASRLTEITDTTIRWKVISLVMTAIAISAIIGLIINI